MAAGGHLGYWIAPKNNRDVVSCSEKQQGAVSKLFVFTENFEAIGQGVS